MYQQGNNLMPADGHVNCSLKQNTLCYHYYKTSVGN